MKLERITKMWLNEMYSTVRVGKLFSGIFPLKKGLKERDALSPLLYNFDLEYAIRMVHVKQDCLKLNDTCQLIVYADDVYILGGSVIL